MDNKALSLEGAPIGLDHDRVLMYMFLMRYKPGTRDIYKIYLTTFYEWCARGGLTLSYVKRVHVQMYVEDLLREKSIGTVYKHIGVMKSFYSLLEADDVVIKNPVAHIALPRYDHGKVNRPHLNRTQFCDLLSHAQTKGNTEELIVLLLGVMGLRATELCNLDIESIAKHSHGYRMLEFVGKGDKFASLPIPVMVNRVLERHLIECGRTVGPLLLSNRGERFTRGGVSASVKRMTAVARVPVVTAHALRRSMVTNSLNAGADIREVQRAARHTDVRTTSKVYDQGPSSYDSSSLNVLAGFISGAI